MLENGFIANLTRISATAGGTSLWIYIYLHVHVFITAPLAPLHAHLTSWLQTSDAIGSVVERQALFLSRVEPHPSGDDVLGAEANQHCSKCLLDRQHGLNVAIMLTVQEEGLPSSLSLGLNSSLGPH